jgi:hypothetical protein
LKRSVVDIKKALNSIQVGPTCSVLNLLGNSIDIIFNDSGSTETESSGTKLTVKKILLNNGWKLPGSKPTNTVELSDLWYIISSEQRHFLEFMKPFSDLSANQWEIIGHFRTESRRFSTANRHPSAFREFKQIKKSLPDLKSRLKSACIEMSIGKYYGLLSYKVDVSLFKVANAKCWLKEYSPNAILTEYDREFRTTSWICAAKELGIKTYTLTHGSTIPIDNYIPITADKVFTWGSISSAHFVTGGTPKEKVVEGGNPRARHKINLSQAELREKWGINEHESVAILISNNIKMEWRSKLVQLFAQAKDNNIRAIVKLHPREKKSDYQEVDRDNMNKLTLVDSSEMNADEAMVLGDFFAGHNSVMLLECLLMGKPSIILNNIPMDCGIGLELAQNGGMPIVKNEKEFTHAFRQMSEAAYRQKIVSAATDYIESHCIRRGKDAAEFITNYILNDHV